MACCHFCAAPVPDDQRLVFTATGTLNDYERIAHRRCWEVAVWLPDSEALAEIRRQACAQGYHQSPGWGSCEWTLDPADPYGDAAYWECVHGCGHIQRHPGYGINRAIAAAEGALLPDGALHHLYPPGAAVLPTKTAAAPGHHNSQGARFGTLRAPWGVPNVP
jgi:hypothetical protein